MKKILFILIILCSCSLKNKETESNHTDIKKESKIDTVYINAYKIGAFHKSVECRYVLKSNTEYIIEDSIIAIDKGYKPCAFCYTEKNEANINENVLKKHKIKKKTKNKPREILNEPL